MTSDHAESLSRLARRDSATLGAASIRTLSADVVAAAQAVFGQHLRAVVLHGSAVMGGFIPYFSDFDVRLVVDSAALRNATTPTHERAIAFQERIGLIDPEDFGVGYIQVSQVAWNDHNSTTVPGTFRVIAGEMPRELQPTERQTEQLFSAARAHLSGLDALINKHVHSLFDRANSGLAHEVRYVATSLRPSVRQAAIVLGVPTADPLTTWQAPFSELVSAIEDAAIPNHGISRFYREVIGSNPTADGWLSLRQDHARLRQIFALGIESLLSMRDWYG